MASAYWEAAADEESCSLLDGSHRPLGVKRPHRPVLSPLGSLARCVWVADVGGASRTCTQHTNTCARGGHRSCGSERRHGSKSGRRVLHELSRLTRMAGGALAREVHCIPLEALQPAVLQGLLSPLDRRRRR